MAPPATKTNIAAVAGPPSGPDAWECSDCGWTVRQGDIGGGLNLRDVLEKHLDKYCASPPTWPPG